MSALQEVKPEASAKPQYKEAIKWFDIWGRVVKERVVSGDASAVPAYTGTPAPGGDSSPSDPSGMLMTFADVETFLAKHATPRQKLLAAFIHAFGVEDVVVSVVYVFADGSRSEPMPVTAPRPVQAASGEYTSRRRTLYDLTAFPDATVDTFCAGFHWDKGQFLEREHRRLLVSLTKKMGLDPQ